MKKYIYLVFSIFILINLKSMENFNQKYSVSSLKKIAAEKIINILFKESNNKTIEFINDILHNLPSDLQTYLKSILIEKNHFILINLSKKSYELSKHQNQITSVAFNNKAPFLLTGSMDEKAILWNLENLNDIDSINLDGHKDIVTSVFFSPNGRYAVTKSSDNIIRIWNIADIKNIKSLTLSGHKNPMESIAFSQTKNYAITGSKEKTEFWDLSKNKFKSILLNQTANSNKTKAVAISKNGDLALSSLENLIILWDLKNFPKIKSIKLNDHNGTITSLALSPDHKYALSGSEDCTSKLWILGNLKNIQSQFLIQVASSSVKSVWFSPSGKYAITKYISSGAVLSNLSNVSKIKSIVLSGHTSFSINSVKFSPNEKYLIINSNEITPTILDISDFDNIKSFSLPGHNNLISDAFFNHNNKYAITASWDGLIIIHDLSNLNNPKQILLKNQSTSRINSTRISKDNNYIISGLSNNKAVLWKIKPDLTFEQILLIAKMIFLHKKTSSYKNLLENDFFKKIYNTLSENQKNILKKSII